MKFLIRFPSKPNAKVNYTVSNYCIVTIAIILVSFACSVGCNRTDGSIKNEGNILAGLFVEQKADLRELLYNAEQAVNLCKNVHQEFSFIRLAPDSVQKSAMDSLSDVITTHCLQVNALWEDASRLHKEVNRDHQNFNDTYKKILQNKLTDETAKRQMEACGKSLEMATQRIAFIRQKYTSTVLAHNEAVRSLSQLSPELNRFSTFKMPPLKEKINIRQ